MSVLATAKELLAAGLRFAGEADNGNSALHDKALEYLNHAYRSVLGGPSEFDLDFNKPFSWARKIDPISVVLKPRFTEGTIAVTNGSATITLSDPPSFSLEDYHIKFNGRPEFYRITSHTSGNASATLETSYIGDTEAAKEFDAIKLIYDLGANVLRISDAFRVSRPNDWDNADMIEHLPLNYFKEAYPLRRVQQRVPREFTVISESLSSFKVMFNSFVDDDTLAQIDIVEYPADLTDSDGDEPIIPVKDRIVLSYLTASQLLLNDKKENDRAQVQLGMAKSMLRSMIERENKRNTVANRNYGRVIPRRDRLNRRGRAYYN